MLSRICRPLIGHNINLSRHFVSESFHCKQTWGQRLESKIIANIRPNLGEFFVALDRKFGTEHRGSALDVDIFANAVDTESELEHLQELLFKLRRTPHTVHSPLSTNHAAVRAMMDSEEHLNHLLDMLDDRTNYGVFLDNYSAVLVLNKMLVEGRLVGGARVASHIMLQEEEGIPSICLANLACWRYMSSGRSDPWYAEEEDKEPEDPDDVIRIRVKGMVPNNYHDDHFDLRDPDKILGKTLWYLNRQGTDAVTNSLRLLGLVLWGKIDMARMESGPVVKDVVEHVLQVSNDNELNTWVEGLEVTDVDIEGELVHKIKEILVKHEREIIKNQVELYQKWDKEREMNLQAENEALIKKTKTENIAQIRDNIARDEERLFFFSNLDRMEQEKEEKLESWRKTFPRKNWGRRRLVNDKRPDEIGQDRKEARWERREKKRGPPK